MAPRLLLAGLAVLAAAGCGGGGGTADEAPEKKDLSAEAQKALDELSATDRPPDDAAAIERLLRDRVQALERRDVAAYAATATGAQRARDRRAARRAVRMSIEHVRLVPDDLQTSGNGAKVTVTMSYRVRGMSRPFLTSRRLTIRRTADDWRISRDVARAEPLPWEISSFRLTRAPHIVLLTPPGVDVEPLRSGLAAAYREIRRDLPARDLPRSVLVIGARDAAQTERLTGRIARGVVALANVRVDFGPPPAMEVERVLAQRMIVVDSRWSTLPPAERQSTLVHEMTHTALNPDTSGRTPPWLVEGVAMFVSGDDRAEEARLRAAGAAPSVKLSQLCRPNSIFKLGGRDQGAAYAASSAAAEAIVDRHGTKALFRLYDAFNDSTIKGRTCAAMTDRVMRRTLDMSFSELEAAVAGG
jgi:ketosteroid isomerase-like protein